MLFLLGIAPVLQVGSKAWALIQRAELSAASPTPFEISVRRPTQKRRQVDSAHNHWILSATYGRTRQIDTVTRVPNLSAAH